jgi:RNA processing factor Prp31
MQLIVECNQLAVDIDNEIAIVHNFVRDKYRAKFPELESLVMHPVDYSRVVKAIGNEMVRVRSLRVRGKAMNKLRFGRLGFSRVQKGVNR